MGLNFRFELRRSNQGQFEFELTEGGARLLGLVLNLLKSFQLLKEALHVGVGEEARVVGIVAWLARPLHLQDGLRSDERLSALLLGGRLPRERLLVGSLLDGRDFFRLGPERHFLIHRKGLLRLLRVDLLRLARCGHFLRFGRV